MYMTQGLRRAASLNPDIPACLSESRELSWREVRDRVARLAGALHKLGLEAGDRVAMLALNSDRYLEFYYGVFWAAGAVVPMNIRWSVPEHIYSIDDSGARFLIVDDAFAEAGKEIAEQCKAVEFLIYAGDKTAPDGMLDYESLIAGAEPAEDAVCGGETLAGIFYTGGTTGFPKGVMLPHRGLWASALCFGSDVSIGPEDRTIHAAPMFHIAGSAMLFAVTIFGGAHVFIPGFEPGVFLKAVAKHRPTLTLLVPTMIRMLIDAPALATTDTSCLKQMIYGASPISESVLREAMDKLAGTKFIHAYGQTELSPLATILGPEYHVLEGEKAKKRLTVGRPVVAAELEIVDPDGKEVPRGTVGEIRVRGATTMLGYWNKPEQTAQALRDGWVHTGDGGTMDEDGFVTIVDRIKDMIVSGGENVYSVEVENAIMKFDGVSECAVFGIPDEKWGEGVHAVVVPKEGASVDPDALKAHCKTLIAGYKCPHSIEIRAEPLPKSGAGKIQKFGLREPFWEGRDRRVG